MPRSQQSPLGKVLEYFRTVNLATLPDAYGLVQDIVRQRQGRSQQAKKQAKQQTQTVGGPIAAAVPQAAAAPKPAKAKGKPGPKKSHKKKAPAPALAAATQGQTGQGQTLSVPLPDAGADPGVLQPVVTGEEFEPAEVAGV